MSITWLDICLGALGLFFVQRILVEKPLGRLPPGPKKWPLLGNILDMPTSKEWLTFAEWGRTYGDILSVTVLGRPLIIINSTKIAVDILDKKSAKYSDRAVMPMAGELVGWKNSLILLPYGERFREYRRYFHQLIGSKSSMEQFLPIEETETHKFLQKVMENPADLATHVRRTAGAIILQIAYGYELQGDNDPFVDLVDRAVLTFSLSASPGAWLVDLLPFLMYVPAWMPGAGFKRTAKKWNDILGEMVDMPYSFTKQQIAAGTAPSSFVSNLLEGKKLSIDEVFNIKWSAASLYSGGADTTVSAIYSLFLAMTLFPEVQKKAQAEIDAVVGNERLPSFSDRSQLPYVEALAKEVLRWNVVAPLAIPHRAEEDDFQEGYFIPRGSLIIPNIWVMLHDERLYPNPSEFNPDRYIPVEGKEPQQDPRSMCFGFGRRICPGLNLADASLFISCAMSLAVFDIKKAVENGVEITPVVDTVPGAISHPVPFKCSIQPRSSKAAALIQGHLDH